MGCSINMAWTLTVLAAAASMAAIQATPARVHPVARTDSGGCEDAIYANDGGQGFAEYFDDGKDGLLQDWFFSGPWGNGHPFDVGFDPNYYNINDQDVLELLVKREPFSNNGQSYPFTAGEIKSRNFYSAGTSAALLFHLPVVSNVRCFATSSLRMHSIPALANF
jgi:hypothetical protein